MKLIVGLGNPGKEYAGTRHNAGFMALDGFAERHGFPAFAETKKAKGMTSRGRLGAEEVLLLKPSTFMNGSGDAVAATLSFNKVTTKNFILVHDDLAFPLGTIRIAQQGSGGGHNGVQSVIDSIGTYAFIRVRIGIGPIAAIKVTSKKYVLDKFLESEHGFIADAIAKTVITLDMIIESGVVAAMQEMNNY